MASSRLEKIGTIFSRVNGLLKSGAMKWEDRPIWYDIYKSNPPINEPKYDRPPSDLPVENILYEEDIIRAKYHNEVKPGTYNLFNNDIKTKTRKFIEEYNKIEAMETYSKDEIFEMAVSNVNKELGERRQAKENNESTLVKNFKSAQEEQNKKLDISKIMKDE